MIITKDNYQLVLNKLVNGYIQSDYNRECFGMRDIMHHLSCGNDLQKTIDAIREAGYEPYYVIKPILEEYDLQYYPEPDPSLKKVDEKFKVEISVNNFDWCEHVWKLKNFQPFEFEGVKITDPYLDETGRFEVDPLEYYPKDKIKKAFKKAND